MDCFSAKILKKRIKKEADPKVFLSHCLNEKPVIQLFCLTEKEKSVQQFKKLHDLSGQRLIWEFCQAYKTLPQVPIANLTTMFVILKVSFLIDLIISQCKFFLKQRLGLGLFWKFLFSVLYNNPLFRKHKMFLPIPIHRMLRSFQL